MTSHTQTCITAGIWCVPKKYMNCHKVPLTFGDDKKQTDKTDYPDAFFGAPSQPASAKSPKNRN